ncbi:MFS transporter [Paenibacillus montaniterrae]|uniref:MFS transporter n=1 Tax=Paenibacillus montaniterrae TaxID=429341 RepID=A0A919YMH4_9BACL|nr:MFS transporter [Paenibacillus montaniterrae]GIP16200.1 MFS transporter [Paenibacillus montaniterrae]
MSNFWKDAKQRKLLTNAGFSWLFDAMDIGMLSFIIAALAVSWDLGADQVGWLTAINSIGMAVGAALAGAMADRYGRRIMLLATLVLFCVATGLSAFATSFAMLCVLRFIAGIGLGGELPVASTLVSESVPIKERGRIIVILESFWAAGWLVAALISYFVIPDYGWRVAFIIGALPVFYAIYLRRAIKDSPRYVKQANEQKLNFLQRVRFIWSKPYRRSTLVLWILWFMVVFSYYGMFLWLPSVMVLKGFTLVKSFQYVLLMTIAQLPGYFTAAYFIEKFGRKFVLVVYLTLTAVCALWFGLAETEASLLTAGALLSFFNLGAWGGMYAYTPELYPTPARATGVGFAASFGRIGGILGPFLVGMLVASNVAISTIFAIFFVSILIGVVAILIWGKETKGIDPDAESQV